MISVSSRSPQAVWAFVCAVTVGLTACTSAPQPQPTPAPTTTSAQRTVDDVNQFSTVWVDNAIVDLMAPEGTFVRAMTESLARVTVGNGTGLAAFEDAGYPGFVHAFNNADDPKVWGGIGDRSKEWVGTSIKEVVSSRRNGDQFAIAVCAYSFLVAARTNDGRYKGSGNPKNFIAERFTFGPDPGLPADRQRSPTSNQRGPAPKPTDNVFGTWILTKFEFGDALLSECGKTALPGVPPDWPTDRYDRVDPPPTLPPSPGWPEGGVS